MHMATISDRVFSVINDLEQGETLEAKLARLAECEVQRRLARYQLADRLFTHKYGMSLEQFETREMVKKLDYSFILVPPRRRPTPAATA